MPIAAMSVAVRCARASACVAAAACVALVAALTTLRGTEVFSTGSAENTSVPLIVHEWGTFTSVAGQDGQAVNWEALGGPQDLPCFVTKQNPISIKGYDIYGLLKI